MNPFDPDLFAVSAPCMPCCNQPAECACALLIPPFASPYADYATAETVIADQVIDCMGFVSSGATGSVARTANGFDAAASGVPTGMYVSVYAKAGTLTDAFTNSTGAMAISTLALYAEDGTELDSDVASGVSGTLSVDVPADGCYVVFVFGGNAPGDPPSSWTHSVTSSAGFYVNPVIALWDDSGTTRKLWACPKLLLPPLTEATGDWYADCAAALADITDHSTACAVYVTPNADSVGASIITFPPPPSFAFTASASNTATGSAPPIPTMNAWVSVNLTSGDTMNVAWDYSSYISVLSAWVVTVSLYDDDGVIIGTPQTDSSNTSGSFNFSAPYTGRFTVRFEVTGETTGPGPGGDFTSFSISDFDITCSGSFTANPIQARYDLGLDCAGLLDCGDSCP